MEDPPLKDLKFQQYNNNHINVIFLVDKTNKNINEHEGDEWR